MKTPALPLEEAQARLLALAEPLPIERVAIENTLGRYLAEPLKARRTQPVADLSAMDGYAMLSDNMAGPWRVIGESAAGHPFDGIVHSGEAVRISTGAIMPARADAVILQEDLKRAGNHLELTGEPPSPPGKHIRRKGMDFREGGEVLQPGTRIGPAQVALAVSAGHARLAVHRRPRIAIIDSGDELAPDCENCAVHQIPASNGIMLAAMAAPLPCEIERFGPVADDLAALTQVLRQAEHADVIVTSGGASVGEHDLIRPALEAWGAELDFWRVAIKPGKPILVARKGKQIVLGLPGNPVSSLVTGFLFLLPLLRALSGAESPLPRRIEARLGAPLKPSGPRREFLRAFWNGAEIVPQTVQDSGALAALSASNALIDRPAEAPPGSPGDAVIAYLLENGGVA